MKDGNAGAIIALVLIAIVVGIYYTMNKAKSIITPPPPPPPPPPPGQAIVVFPTTVTVGLPVQFKVTGLSPDTPYEFDVWNNTTKSSQIGNTPFKSGSDGSFSFAFTSTAGMRGSSQVGIKTLTLGTVILRGAFTVL